MVYWSPGHADVHGNNIADDLANEDSEMSKPARASAPI